MLVYRGEVPEDMALDLPTLSGSYGFPIKYGYAAAGYVLGAGPGVRSLSAGDYVFVHHPHQEVFTAPAEMTVRLPRGVDPLLGVFAANLETAINIIHDTPVRLGETALVFGQGVVGLLVSQLLKMSGAGRVLAVEPIKKRRALALDLGADEVFEPGEDLNLRLREATGGRGADVAVEVSGSGAALQSAIESVAEEGTVVAASWYGTKSVSLALGGHFHRGRVKILSSQVGRTNPALAPRWDRERRMKTVMEFLPRMELGAMISHRLPFAEAPEAYRLLDERPEEAIQVVLDYGD